MRQLYIALAFVGSLLCSSTADAGCKIESSQDFNGATERAVWRVRMRIGSLGVVEKGGDVELVLPIWQDGAVDAALVQGPVRFLLEDGTTFDLIVQEPVAPKAHVWGSSVLTGWNPALPIGEEQLRGLERSRIILLEVPLEGQKVRLERKTDLGWLSKQTQKLAHCWLERA